MSTDDDAVQMYLRELEGIQPLSKEEEAAAIQQFRGGGEERETAARIVIENYLPLVVRIAARYSSSGVPFLDIIQEGNIGLFAALKTFVPGSAQEFSEHAAVCIERAIVGVIRKNQAGKEHSQ